MQVLKLDCLLQIQVQSSYFFSVFFRPAACNNSFKTSVNTIRDLALVLESKSSMCDFCIHLYSSRTQWENLASSLSDFYEAGTCVYYIYVCICYCCLNVFVFYSVEVGFVWRTLNEVFLPPSFRCSSRVLPVKMRVKWYEMKSRFTDFWLQCKQVWVSEES